MPRCGGDGGEVCLGIKASWERWLKRQMESNCGEFGLDLRGKAGCRGGACRGRMLYRVLDSVQVFGIRVEATERQKVEREDYKGFLSSYVLKNEQILLCCSFC